MPFVVEVLKSHDKLVFKDTTQTTKEPGSNDSWVDVKTEAGLLDLAKPSLVVIQSQFVTTFSSHTNEVQECNVRLGVGPSDGMLWHGGKHWKNYNEPGTYTFDFQGFAVLPAGLHDLLVQVKVLDAGYVEGGYNTLRLGVVELEDLFKKQSWKEEDVMTQHGHRTTFGTTTVPKLSRNCVMGPIRKALLFVFLGVDDSLIAGDGASSNFCGFRILVDGEEQHSRSNSTKYSIHGFNWAQCFIPVDAQIPHEVKFQQSNGSGSTCTNDYFCGVIACPWMFPSSEWENIVDIEVPVESTVYGTAEDLFDVEQAKDIAVRSKNVLNGEQSVQSFHQDAGSTDPLHFNYTPEWYETAIKLGVKGLWNCLSRLGVDLRG